MEKIASAFAEGGAWMYIILATSIVGVGIIVERFIFLFFKYNINATAFMAQIQKLVMANKIDHAIKLCNAAPSAALARVIKAGLTKANKGEIEIQNAVEEATLEVVPYIQKRTNSLGPALNISMPCDGFRISAARLYIMESDCLPFHLVVYRRPSDQTILLSIP